MAAVAAGRGAGASDSLRFSRETTASDGSTGLGARLVDMDGAGGFGLMIVVFVGLAGGATGTFAGGAATAESCVEAALTLGEATGFDCTGTGFAV